MSSTHVSMNMMHPGTAAVQVKLQRAPHLRVHERHEYYDIHVSTTVMFTFFHDCMLIALYQHE